LRDLALRIYAPVIEDSVKHFKTHAVHISRSFFPTRWSQKSSQEWQCEEFCLLVQSSPAKDVLSFDRLRSSYCKKSSFRTAKDVDFIYSTTMPHSQSWDLPWNSTENALKPSSRFKDIDNINSITVCGISK
jgi:hypothetical protein